jgi:hypothetical protein
MVGLAKFCRAKLRYVSLRYGLGAFGRIGRQARQDLNGHER